MHDVLVLLMIVVGLPVICVTAIVLSAMNRSRSKSSQDQLSREEDEILREIHRDLVNLRKRIDNLEILYGEKNKQGR